MHSLPERRPALGLMGSHFLSLLKEQRQQLLTARDQETGFLDLHLHCLGSRKDGVCFLEEVGRWDRMRGRMFWAEETAW